MQGTTSRSGETYCFAFHSTRVHFHSTRVPSKSFSVPRATSWAAASNQISPIIISCTLAPWRVRATTPLRPLHRGPPRLQPRPSKITHKSIQGVIRVCFFVSSVSEQPSNCFARFLQSQGVTGAYFLSEHTRWKQGADKAPKLFF